MSDTHKKELEELDKQLASLTFDNVSLEERLAILEANSPIDPVTLTRDEFRQVLLAFKNNLIHDGSSVYTKQDQGVYCQIKRSGQDTLHIYVQVPDEFVLDQYNPPTG